MLRLDVFHDILVHHRRNICSRFCHQPMEEGRLTDLSRDFTGVLGLVVGCSFSFRLLARSTSVLLQRSQHGLCHFALFRMRVPSIPDPSSNRDNSICSGRALRLCSSSRLSTNDRGCNCIGPLDVLRMTVDREHILTNSSRVCLRWTQMPTSLCWTCCGVKLSI